MAASTRQGLDDAVGEHQEIEGQVVHIEPLVIEIHAPPVGTSSHEVSCTGTGTLTGKNSGTDPEGRPGQPPPSLASGAAGGAASPLPRRVMKTTAPNAARRTPSPPNPQA